MILRGDLCCIFRMINSIMQYQLKNPRDSNSLKDTFLIDDSENKFISSSVKLKKTSNGWELEKTVPILMDYTTGGGEQLSINGTFLLFL